MHFSIHTSRGSNHSPLTSSLTASAGARPHRSGPIQLSSLHLRPPAVMCVLYIAHAPCFRKAILTLAPHAFFRLTPSAVCHLNMSLSVLSVHSLVSASWSLPMSAQSSASSLSGSPRCALTLTRNVAAPACILALNFSMIFSRMSALATPTSVAFAPSPIHFPTSVISDLQSSLVRLRHPPRPVPLATALATLPVLL